MKKATDTTVTLNVSKDLIEQANGMFAWVFDKAGNLVEKPFPARHRGWRQSPDLC
ncbi:MAG: hypothetical protein ACFCUG_15825 [Thiotrichales bacterium]